MRLSNTNPMIVVLRFITFFKLYFNFYMKLDHNPNGRVIAVFNEAF